MTNGRLAATITLCCLVAASTACSYVGQSNSQQSARAMNRAASSDAVEVGLNFSLTNFTGTSLRGVYLSPSSSGAWEENVLGAMDLKDGDTVDIRFNQNEQRRTWDMKVEGVDGRFAEWKNLELGDVSGITLVLKPRPQTVVVAELE